MYEKYGINYKKPKVKILHSTPLLVAEIAGRVAYDSFSFSEHDVVKDYYSFEETPDLDAEESILLEKLAWVHHHLSVLEQIDINYFISGIGRGVLQELMRHRISSPTVRSTRYTMQEVLHAFNISTLDPFLSYEKVTMMFRKLIKDLNLYALKDKEFIFLEIDSMFNLLFTHKSKIGEEEFLDLSLSKEAKKLYSSLNVKNLYDNYEDYYKQLMETKDKRNVGDPFKYIVTTNWSVDLVIKFNLRSLKNFFELRDSGAAWFQIEMLAKEMKKKTDKKYLRLIDKKYKDEILKKNLT